VRKCGIIFDPCLYLTLAFVYFRISATGIATAWYASIYPFLANSKLLDRATEAMELSDAGMPVDLSWLSEKSIPLFLTFMALQVTHELAHRAVAQSKDFEISIPTVVPSILTGITSTITSLKTQPKNKQDLLDFAIAGPLAGMVLSIGVLVYGLILTATADPDSLQSFPGLPLFLLRQSSLGGGIVDGILGNGVLNVPMSAEGAQSLATTLISLHPFAVAGFVSLIVKALARVPIGRTDGGRVSLALFGRSGSQAVAFASLVALAILGFTGSDVFLFYFAFVTFFQSELEIPMRNEVDDVDFSRVVLATFAGLLMLLTLIPM
jgi:Zn-dependent protease